MRGNQKAALGFIFVTVLLDIIGLGIIIPVIPHLIMELTGQGYSHASGIGGWLLFSYALMLFLFAPILGGLSDRYGRRKVLLISIFGFGVDYLFMALAPSLTLLFIGRIISGITGATHTTASAYVADISTPEKKAQNFGLIGAAFGLGFTVGPVIGGILGEFGSRIPFFVAAGLTLLNWLYGYIILPESLSQENRRPFSWQRANPVGTLLQLGKYPVVTGLLVSIVLIYLAHHATQSTWAYFTGEKFGWGPAEVGYSLGFVGIMIALVQAVIIRRVVKVAGPVKTAYLGLAFVTLGYILLATVTQGWMIYVTLVPYALGGLSGPSIQGIMSNSVEPNQQGELQGGLSSLMSVTTIFGPLIMTNLFGYFTGNEAPVYLPSAPFYLASVLAFFSIIFIYRTLSRPLKQ